MANSGYMKLAELYMGVATETVIAGAGELRRLRFEPVRATSTIGRAGHTGAPAHSIDIDMDAALRSIVYEFDKEIVFMGEESATGANLRPGRIFAHCDAIDGTTNLRALGCGWAIVVFFERVRTDGVRLAHLGGAIYAHNGTIVSWARSGVAGVTRIHYPAAASYDMVATLKVPGDEGRIGRAASARTVTLKRGRDDTPSKLLRPGTANYVAAVAASSERRARTNELYDLATGNVTFWTLGGNPIIEPLMTGELGAVVEPEQVVKHDCVYLLPLAIAGGHVYDHDGRELNVFALFDDVSCTTVEPFVAVVDPSVAARLHELRR